MLYRSEAWCLNESEMWHLRRMEWFMVRAMCGVQLKDRKISKDLMLGWNKKGSVGYLNECHGHVLRREDGHVLRSSLDFGVEGQKKKGRHVRSRVEAEGGKVGLRGEDGHILRRALSFEFEWQRKKVHGRRRLRENEWRLVWAGKMRFADQGWMLELIRLLLAWGQSVHPHLLGIQPDFQHWCLSLHGLIVFLAIRG